MFMEPSLGGILCVFNVGYIDVKDIAFEEEVC
jgi:hypothetical protein